jgi:parvulin-like peptidyl-prolyl isomerase
MSKRWTLIALLLLGSTGLHAGELLDGMVATVNNRVILQSDWDDEVRYECFMSGRKLLDPTAGDRKAALDRLIDQEILREQMNAAGFKSIPAEAIKKQIDALKSDHNREHAGELWATTLSRYQLSESVVENHVASELEQFQFIDTRFRPSIQVSAAEVEKYYQQEIVPKLPTGDPVSLADATPKIREILVQGKINQLLNSWLETLRAQAHILVMSANDSEPAKVEAR